ncbi:MAG: L-2-hydroxyglutarate oxidase [Melioribacteraceae bacterium]|nr:L-2-hydroxyglutarate oxidase [Melioribacteraceae bacterium]
MKFNYIVIGAGIVGLAAAYKILLRSPGASVLVIEKEEDVAQHQTGNNSGVIHSGIYYKPGSLKALNCRKGYRQLLEFCDEHDVKYDICGKIIVAANDAEIPLLENIYLRGIENGLENLKRLEAKELKEYEPNVKGVSGVFVPQTGIIDFKEVCIRLKDFLCSHGVEFKFNEMVEDIRNSNPVFVRTQRNEYFTEFLVTCAGLHSDKLAALTEENIDFRIIPFRGEYYKLKDERKDFVKNLIYPVPNPDFPFLGVHFTRMINGGVECGPNAVFSFKREGYSKTDFSITDTFNSLTWPGLHKVATKYWKIGLGEFYRSFSKRAFVKALRILLPSISENDLTAGGSGVRAQACDRRGGLMDDFYILENKNIFHVCNAPSPAATAALAIGEYIADKVIKH